MTTKSVSEVVLAEEGALLAEFQKARTDAMSRMFDRDEMCGQIHTTSHLYAELDNAVSGILNSLLDKAESEVKGMEERYPVSVFPEPWDGWQKDIENLAKSKGGSIDCVSAWYARWQEKLVKDDVLQILSNLRKEIK